MKFVRCGLFVSLGLVVAVAWWTERTSPTLSSRRVETTTKQPVPEVSKSSLGSPIEGFASGSSTSSTLDVGGSPKPSNQAFQGGYGEQWGKESSSALSDFSAWCGRFIDSSDIQTQQAMLNEGLSLASTRRQFMEQLIQKDPAQAIASAVPWRVRSRLPKDIASMLERNVSGKGDLELVASTQPPGVAAIRPTIQLKALIDTNEYTAFVYGRRSKVRSQPNLSLHGVAVGSSLAVHESPVRVMEAEEMPLPRAALNIPSTCAYCQRMGHASRSVEDGAVKLEFQGHPQRVCNVEEFKRYEALLIQEEIARTIPRSESGSSIKGGAATSLGSPGDPGWTPTGTKQVLMIRVDFSDFPGEPTGVGGPLNEGAALNLINSISHNFYQENSYRQTGLNGIVTPVLRMPSTAAYYGTNDLPLSLHSDARALAITNGYLLSSYDFIFVAFRRISGNEIPGSSFWWAGLGNIFGRNSWLNGFFDARVTTHEFGHNFGLYHADFWSPSDDSITGNGSAIEYGDLFDTMGSDGGESQHHFNPWFKQLVGWMTPASSVSVHASGLYQIERFDHIDSSGIRSLVIPWEGTTNLWIAFRRSFPDTLSLSNGAYCFWGRTDPAASLLLDMTPGSQFGGSDAQDAGLEVGRTFSDSARGIHITPIETGGISPHEYLRVAVNLGTFAGNRAPAVSSITAPSTGIADDLIELRVAASDPDGDALAYHWDFEDGSASVNSAVVRHAWMQPGTYFIRCEVSDMKGRSSVDYAVITIQDPMSRWTARRLGSPVSLESIGFIAPRWVGIGNKFIRSTDLISWQQESLPASSLYLREFTRHGDLSVAVGNDFDSGSAQHLGYVTTTTDGVTWTGVRREGPPLKSVCSGGGKLVAAGDRGSILTSLDGTNWQVVAPLSLEILTGVCHGDPGFVVVGGQETIMHSADGLTWTSRQLGGARMFHGVAHGNGTYVAMWDGGFYLSTDGVNWNSSGFERPHYRLQGITFADGRFAATGRGDGKNLVLTSRDGISWNVRDAPNGFTILDIDFARGSFFLFGEGETVYQSDPLHLDLVLVESPVSRTVVRGDTIEFSVRVEGGAPLTYQWMLGGIPIPDATNATLRLENVLGTHAGAYTVVVANDTGMVTAGPATLTVNAANQRPTITTPADQITYLNQQPLEIHFTVADLETPSGLLVVTAASSNPILIPESGLSLGGTTSARGLTITPLAGQFGSSEITLNVRDAHGGEGGAHFMVTVSNAVIVVNRWTKASSIPIPDNPAGPVYSSLNIPAFTGAVVRTRVILHELEHSFLSDLDILVVGPIGQAVMLLSDAGFQTFAAPPELGATLTFSSTAIGRVPELGNVGSGVFQPTDYPPFVDLPAPAPPKPYATDLTTGFVGSASLISGTWGLFLFDHAESDVGTLHGGWTVEVETLGPGIGDPPTAVEADVAPRPDGNGSGTVSIADWVLVGRFAAGLEFPANGSEFQRADCAPTNTMGNGRITVSDWVQAGRYAAGLDPIYPAAGPTEPAGALTSKQQPEIGIQKAGNASTFIQLERR